ncbi:hypothetical protein H6P81_017618 [Aristolochia fimbriata]|uniref:Uncharacterized protein n=1 Tax=Aristolochia fimbriata TaxID=158543 RepID=A0AAV7DZQ3_ARIFI|nr:hypothetical protein H6P81_017618 [Aristolochia fimbriata]
MKNAKAANIAAVLFLVWASTELTGAIEAADLVKQKKGNCTYTVLIETTCTEGAGTSDHISVRFGDAKSNDVLVRHLKAKHIKRVDSSKKASTDELDDVPREPFRACGVDQFRVVAPCMESPVCYMYLKQIGKDGWRPGLAQVLVGEEYSGLSSESFYFRRYLPRHVWHGSDMCDTTVTPFGIKYVRKVFPSKH